MQGDGDLDFEVEQLLIEHLVVAQQRLDRHLLARLSVGRQPRRRK
jgi:hypothetical protein